MTDTIQVSRAEYEALRSEVASLKEERDGLAESVQGMYDTLHKYWPGTINELLEDWQRLTQQLAAANGRVEMLKATLEEIKEHASFSSDAPRTDYVEHSAVKGGQLLTIVDLVDAALSNLNEDGGKA
jgi:uncharacterized protein YukE